MFNTIKTLREQNNYSQTAIASYLKISRQMYVKYENGEVDPPVKVISQLCTLYKVPYDVIIEDKLVSEKIDRKDLYKISHEQEDLLCVADVGTSSIPHKNKSISSFEVLLEQIRNLKDYQLPAVMAFVKYLEVETPGYELSNIYETTQKSKTIKSKEDFFKLAGKINLDADELADFREKSLV